MDETRVRHRLLAILAADAVGYPRLLVADERGARAALDAAHAAFRAAIERHGGRVVESAGESVLAVFETARGAIEAAAAAQAEVDAAATAGTSDDGGVRLRFRIGIHLGDVIERDDGSVHGPGVNVAARLQGLAPAGGVMVSDAVRATLGRPSARAFVDEGFHEVRHLAEPVHVYRLRLGQLDAARRPVARARPEAPPRKPAWHRRAWAGGVLVIALAALFAAWLASRPAPPAGTPGGARLVPLSLAVSRFAANGGDADEAERLRRDVLAGLGVAARGFTVIELPDDVAPAARRAAALDAGLRYLLSATVERESGGTAVAVQLVDSGTGTSLWSHRAVLTGPDDARAFQRRELIGRLVGALQAAEIRRVLPLPTEQLSATELVLRAWALSEPPTLARLLEADGVLERALVLDPNDVYALITRAVLDDARYAADPHPDPVHLVVQMDELTGRALALDARDPAAWSARGLALVYLGRWPAATDAYEHALQLDPDSAELRAHRAWLDVVTGRPEAALPRIDATLARKPVAAGLLWRVRCQAELLLGHAPEAVRAGEAAAALDGGSWIVQLLLAAAYANAGDLEHARAALRAVERAAPGYTIERLRAYRYSQHPDYLRLVEERWYPGLRAAGLPER